MATLGPRSLGMIPKTRGRSSWEALDFSDHDLRASPELSTRGIYIWEHLEYPLVGEVEAGAHDKTILEAL
jgi:hypothetical protein